MDLDEARLTATFRRWLAETYPDRIDWETHHKYVGLVFEQAGIGSNRNRIITLFLRLLVETLTAGEIQADAHKVVSETLRQFESRTREEDPSAATDVTALRAVLQRAGESVVDFASFVRECPQKWSLPTWSWERVRAAWQEASGVDPDTLTPSAQDVLLEIVAQLSRIATRNEIFRWVVSGAVRVKLPAGAAPPPWAGPEALPIGPAEITASAGRVDVELVDDEMLPASVLLRHLDGQWRRFGALWYRAEAAPFTARGSFGRVIRSVPIFRGKTVRTAIQAGFYCAAELPEGQNPEHLGEGTTPAPSPKAQAKVLAVRSALFVGKAGLTLWIRSFSTQSTEGDATLMVGGEVVWKGSIADGSPEGWRPLRVLLSAAHVSGTVVPVELAASEGSFYGEVSAALLAQKAILTVGEKVVAPNCTVPVPATSEVRCYLGTTTEPFISGGSYGQITQVQLAGRSFERRDVHCFEHGETETLLRIRGREWHFVCPQPFSYDIDLPAMREMGGVAFHGAAYTRVLLAGESSLIVTIRPGGAWVNPPKHLSLHLRSIHGAMRLPLVDLTRAEELYEFDLLALLGAAQIATGPIFSFGIGAWDADPENEFTVVRVSSVHAPHCRFGQRPCLGIALDGGAEVPVTALDQVTPAWVREGKHAKGRMIARDAEVWLMWRPDVLDWTLDGLAGSDCEYRTSIVRTAQPTIAHFYGPPGTEWNVRVAEADVTVRSGTSADLIPLLQRWKAEYLGESVATIQASLGPELVTWTVDMAPTAVSLTAAYREREGALPIIEVAASVRAFMPERFDVRVAHEGRVVSRETVTFEREEGICDKQFGIALAFPPSTIYSGVRGTVAELVHAGEVSARAEVAFIAPRLETLPSSEQLRTSIVAALKQFGKSGEEAFAEAAMAGLTQYSARYRELPLPPSRLLAPVFTAPPSAQGRPSGLAADSIRLLGNLVGGEASAMTLAPTSSVDSTFLRGLRAALVVFDQHGKQQIGLMLPSAVERACKELESVSSEGATWADWYRAVASFGWTLLRKEVKTDDVKDISTSPVWLKGLYKPFESWLESSGSPT